MSVVTPAERPAASFTAVLRSLALSLSPSIAGALFAAARPVRRAEVGLRRGAARHVRKVPPKD
jgi:hypothetical protein